MPLSTNGPSSSSKIITVVTVIMVKFFNPKLYLPGLKSFPFVTQIYKNHTAKVCSITEKFSTDG